MELFQHLPPLPRSQLILQQKLELTLPEVSGLPLDVWHQDHSRTIRLLLVEER